MKFWKKVFIYAFAIACAINITFAQAWLCAWIIYWFMQR